VYGGLQDGHIGGRVGVRHSNPAGHRRGRGQGWWERCNSRAHRVRGTGVDDRVGHEALQALELADGVRGRQPERPVPQLVVGDRLAEPDQVALGRGDVVAGQSDLQATSLWLHGSQPFSERSALALLIDQIRWVAADSA
jgi:hypothetical protein